MKRIGIVLLCCCAPAIAQQPPPFAQPPPQYYYYVPGPTPAQIDGLEHVGRRHRRVGAILLGAGAGIALVGSGLLIGGAWDDHCDGHHSCGTDALSFAGATTTLIGLGAMIPGIVFYIRGGGEVARARYWRYVLSH
jgi:hypothetical protein